MCSQVARHFMTTGEVAALLGVNRLTVERWASAGKARAQRVGRLILIERESVREIAVQRGQADLVCRIGFACDEAEASFSKPSA